MSGGLKNDANKPGLDMLSTKALIEIAKVLDYGKGKYAKNNWRKGIAFSRLYAAVLRHLMAWNDREDLDPETGLSHLAHASCGLMFLLTFEVEGRKDLDDRYKKENQVNEGKYATITYSGFKVDPKHFHDYTSVSVMPVHGDTISSTEINQLADSELKKLAPCACGKPNCPGSEGI